LNKFKKKIEFSKTVSQLVNLLFFIVVLRLRPIPLRNSDL